MTHSDFFVRDAKPKEFTLIGELMIQVYGNLSGFPSQQEQPEYYKMLANVGNLTKNTKTRLLVAVNSNNQVLGAVVYIGDIKNYGAKNVAYSEKNAAGFRLLAVHPTARGKGIGKLLVNYCLKTAKLENNKQLIIHSTHAMKIAWKMYEKLGFKRATELDFIQDDFPVFGFKLKL